MLRNKEFRRLCILFLITAAGTAAAGFWLSTGAGVLAVVSASAFGMIFLVFTKERYKYIAQISEKIDLVLHDADGIFISDSEEGELSILQSEITKMTLRIRETNAALRKEKEHLADSLADVAHQLRTPLTSINLILSLLENSQEKNERKRLVREMEELLIRMDWLITSLLKLSRLDAGIIVFQNERLDVKALLDTALRPLLIPMELHNVALEMHVPDGIWIFGDLNWLAEAVQNILKNCMESTGDNGKIEIICEDTLLFTEIRFHDSGSGFADEELPCLFDRFYRGKNSSAAGYGIGLSLCRTIITRQGGTVTAKNHSLGGAVFSIRFPK